MSGELDPAEREAVALLLQAAHDALMDQRLDEATVWRALGLVAETLQVAAVDVRAGGRALRLLGGAVRLPDYVDQAVSPGRLERPEPGDDPGRRS